MTADHLSKALLLWLPLLLLGGAAAFCVLAAARWIAARRRLQERERRNAQREACMEASGWAWYELAPGGAMKWSRNASEVLATGESALPGTLEEWLQRIDSPHRDRMRRRYQDLLAGRPGAASQFTLRHAGGPEVACEDIAVPADAAARGRSIAGIVRNTTVLNALQEEARQIQPIASVGRIAGMIAHDLANVLSIIHGQSRLLADSPRQENAGKLASAVMAAAERGRQLCHQILFVARPRAARQSGHAGELIQELRAMLAGLAQPGISIQTEVERAGLVVQANSGRLLQALLNLCINAMEAMKDSGGVLTIRCFDVGNAAPFPGAFGMVPVGRFTCFEVADSGEGIAPQQLARIFEPGYSTREGDAPRGLGLAIIASALTELGAYLDVESKAQAGTRFRIYLANPDPGVQAERVLRPVRLGVGESILIVDPSEENLLRLEDMVADIGYEPNAFASAEEAMRSAGGQHGYRAALVASNATLADGTPLHDALARHVPAFRIVLVCRSSRSVQPSAMTALLEPFTHSDLGAVLAKVVNA